MLQSLDIVRFNGRYYTRRGYTPTASHFLQDLRSRISTVLNEESYPGKYYHAPRVEAATKLSPQSGSIPKDLNTQRWSVISNQISTRSAMT